MVSFVDWYNYRQSSQRDQIRNAPPAFTADQQANRGVKTDPGAILNPGRLNGSPGGTTFLKGTGEDQLMWMLYVHWNFLLDIPGRAFKLISHSFIDQWCTCCCNKIILELITMTQLNQIIDLKKIRAIKMNRFLSIIEPIDRS